MLKTRIMTGAVLTVVFAAVILLSHIPGVLQVVAALLSVLAIKELYQATGLILRKSVFVISCAAAALICLLPIPGYLSLICGLLMAAVLFLFRSFIKLPKVCDAAGLPHRTVHSLRHTNSTMQIAAGVPLATVAGRAGHVRTSTTTDIYSHFLKNSDKSAAEKLEQLFE